MNKVKVITDSCSDLTPEILEKYNLDYAKMATVMDGVITVANLDWTEEESHAFYNQMRDGKRITTSQATAEEFNRIFPLYLEQGYDIVYIGCSLKQSGSVNTGHMVADKLLEKYPNQKISCIDSMNASLGEGLLAVEAAKLAMEGKGIDEITEHTLSIRKTVNQFVTVHSLDHLRRAGRVTASSAFLGNLMGVKPIIISDAVGAQVAVKKVKGRQKSINEVVAMLKEGLIDSENQTIYFAHADCAQEEVDAVVEALRAEIPCKELVVGKIGPIIGASIGPEAIAVFGLGKQITFCGDK